MRSTFSSWFARSSRPSVREPGGRRAGEWLCFLLPSEGPCAGWLSQGKDQPSPAPQQRRQKRTHSGDRHRWMGQDVTSGWMVRRQQEGEAGLSGKERGARVVL